MSSVPRWLPSDPETEATHLLVGDLQPREEQVPPKPENKHVERAEGETHQKAESPFKKVFCQYK